MHNYYCKQWRKEGIFGLIMLLLMQQNMFRFGECFEGHLIKSLPGQPIVNFKQFGGYITIDELQSRSLFYYFVEAQSDPTSKPLVLWLNGG